MRTIKQVFKIGTILIFSLFVLAFGKAQINTEQGYFSVSVDLNTKPLNVGRNTIELVIHDKSTGKPLERKIEIEIIPWMPAHEHGSNEVPIVKEKGRGQYLVERLNFTMPGEWDIYIKIKEGKREDTAVFKVSIEK